MAIVALLRAGDIAARAVSNRDSTFVYVGLIDGSRILWSNSTSQVWQCSIVSKDGVVEGYSTDLPWDAVAEEVARLIATYDYESPVEFPVDDDLTV